MLFKYKGINKLGKNISGEIEAFSLQEAKQKLKSNNILYKTVKEGANFKISNFQPQDMSGLLLSNFSKELSSYLGSKMTILTALKLLSGQHQHDKKYSYFIDSLITMIDEGKSLYQALNNQTVYTLPDFFIQSVNVGGEWGKLTEVLINMGNFFTGQTKIKKQVSSALAYPIFILIVAIGMTSFLIAFIVPKITGIFKDNGQELPPITQYVLSLSDFLINHYILLVVIFVIIFIGFKSLYKFNIFFKIMYDSLLLKIPVVGDLIQNHELSRFSYILSLMLRSGVSYAFSINLASTTFSSMPLKNKFINASIKVIEGNKLSQSLQMVQGIKLKRNFMQALALGEESSEVANIIQNISELYQSENKDKIKLLLTMIEPLMMLLIGGIVGIIVAAMLLPIFSMNLGTPS